MAILAVRVMKDASALSRSNETKEARAAGEVGQIQAYFGYGSVPSNYIPAAEIMMLRKSAAGALTGGVGRSTAGEGTGGTGIKRRRSPPPATGLQPRRSTVIPTQEGDMCENE